MIASPARPRPFGDEQLSVGAPNRLRRRCRGPAATRRLGARIRAHRRGGSQREGAGGGGRMTGTGRAEAMPTPVRRGRFAGRPVQRCRVGPAQCSGRTSMAISVATWVIRDALPRDTFAVTRVLAAAYAGSSLVAWLAPDPDTRDRFALEYVGGLVGPGITSGICRVVLDGDEMIGAAVWSMHPGQVRPVDLATADDPQDKGVAELRRRRCLLERFADDRRPSGVGYQQLALLGVKPQRQRQGIASYLLIGHHAFLHTFDIPSFAVVVDDRVQRLLERHGFTAVGPAAALPGGVPVWAMWRPPRPADAL